MDYIFLLVVFNLFLLFLLYNKKKCNHTGGDGHVKTEEEIAQINLELSNKQKSIDMLNEELEDNDELNPLTVKRKEEIEIEIEQLNKEIIDLENSLKLNENIEEENNISPEHLLNIKHVSKYMRNWCNHNYDKIIDDENSDFDDTKMICRILKE